MYTLKVQGSFSSAHNLRGYKGKCEDLHGHNWVVEITVRCAKLDDIGMVQDFKFLKKNLSCCLEKLDHKYLNQLPYFSAQKKSSATKRRPDSANPTSENIAKYIYDQLKPELALLSSVCVWENSTSCAVYEPGN